MNTAPVCPSCGKPLEPSAPKGLCQECLLQAGFPSGTQTEAGEPKSSFVPPTVEELAAKFPQLEILELIGRGGMGAVYKARQKQLGRIVALKILPPGIGDQPAFAERFTREARALALLNHPGIVTLYEFGQTDGLFFFLMEFVDGVNLRQLLNASRIAPREALAIVPQICDALQYAHDQGIIHRDIKPENILLDRRGRVKVADFGLARLLGMNGEIVGGSETGPESFTETGKVMGTPQYMAPEQKEHPTEVDHRADIYSLGVVFYQMLTGELPDKRIEPPSKKVLVDVRLDEIVLRALEKEPERRYQEASAFKTQVESFATNAPPPASEPGKPVRQRRLGTYESCIDSRGLKDCWMWDTKLVLLTFLIPLILSVILSLSLFRLLGPKAMLFDLLSVVGIIPALVFFLVGNRVRRLKADLPPDYCEVSETVFVRGMNQQPGLAVIYEDRLELVPLVGSKTIITFKDIKSVDDIQRFNGALIWWKAAFVLKTNSDERLQIALPVPVARRWSVYFPFTQGGANKSKFSGTAKNERVTEPYSMRRTFSGFADLTGFRSSLAERICQLAWLGFLGFLGFIPDWERLFGLFGFFGFLGIGGAIEVFGRIKSRGNAADVSAEPKSVNAKFSNTPLAWIALCCAGLSGVLGIIAFCLFPCPPTILVWSILAAALLGIVLGVLTRQTALGKQGIVIGAVNTAIWMIVLFLVNLLPNLSVERGGETKPMEQTSPGSVVPTQSNSDTPMANHYCVMRRCAYIVYDRANVHYVLFYDGEFTSGGSAQRNTRSLKWFEDRNIRLQNGRTFGCQRESAFPEFLRINGAQFDLRKGRTLVLHDDGAVEQFALFPSFQTAHNFDELPRLIGDARKKASTAQSFYFGPVIERVIFAPGTAGNTSADTADCIDLDSGTLFVLPTELASEDSAQRSSARQSWMMKQGIDAVGWGSPVKGLDGVDLYVGLCADELWDRMSADSVEPSLLNIIQQIPPVMQTWKHSKTTWLFRTRAGGMGILQITGVTENPHGVKIRYKLVQRSQQSTRVPGAADDLTSDAGFSPVIERVLPDAEANVGYEALDLATGNILSFPRSRTDNGDWFVPWLSTNKIDLFVGSAGEKPGLLLACVKTRLADFANERWSDATPSECRMALRGGTTLTPLDENGIDEETEKAGVTFYWLPPGPQLPRTFAFQTRNDVQGLLQITGYTEKPRGVKIRYKLVQKVPEAATLQKRRMNEIWQLMTAITKYRDTHNNQWPEALTKTGDYLNSELREKANDYLYKRPETNQEISAMAMTEVLFEKTPISPGGQCVGFADGHVEFKRKPQQNFPSAR